MPRVICEKRNDWLWSKKSPYFAFFQINISVKISVALLRNLCGNLDKKFVSNQSSGLKEMFQGCVWMRCSLDKILSFLVQQVTFPPLQRASLSCEGLELRSLHSEWKENLRKHLSFMAAKPLLGPRATRPYLQQSFTASAGCGQRFSAVYTNTFTSKVSRGLDKPNPKLLDQDKPRLELAVGWISRERRFCTTYTGCLRLI